MQCDPEKEKTKPEESAIIGIEYSSDLQNNSASKSNQYHSKKSEDVQEDHKNLDQFQLGWDKAHLIIQSLENEIKVTKLRNGELQYKNELLLSTKLEAEENHQKNITQIKVLIKTIHEIETERYNIKKLEGENYSLLKQLQKKDEQIAYYINSSKNLILAEGEAEKISSLVSQKVSEQLKLNQAQFEKSNCEGTLNLVKDLLISQNKEISTNTTQVFDMLNEQNRQWILKIDQLELSYKKMAENLLLSEKNMEVILQQLQAIKRQADSSAYQQNSLLKNQIQLLIHEKVALKTQLNQKISQIAELEASYLQARKQENMKHELLIQNWKISSLSKESHFKAIEETLSNSKLEVETLQLQVSELEVKEKELFREINRNKTLSLENENLEKDCLKYQLKAETLDNINENIKSRIDGLEADKKDFEKRLDSSQRTIDLFEEQTNTLVKQKSKLMQELRLIEKGNNFQPTCSEYVTHLKAIQNEFSKRNDKIIELQGTLDRISLEIKYFQVYPKQETLVAKVKTIINSYTNLKQHIKNSAQAIKEVERFARSAQKRRDMMLELEGQDPITADGINFTEILRQHLQDVEILWSDECKQSELVLEEVVHLITGFYQNKVPKHMKENQTVKNVMAIISKIKQTIITEKGSSSRLYEEVSRMKNQIKLLNQGKNRIEEKSRTLTSQNSDLNNKLGIEKEKFQKLVQEKNAVENEREKVKKDLKNETNQLRKTNDKLGKAQEDIKTANSKIKDLQKEIRDIRIKFDKEILVMKGELEKLKKKQTNLLSLQIESQNQIKSLKSEINDLSSKAMESMIEISGLINSIEKEESNSVVQDNKIKSLNQQVSDLEAKIRKIQEQKKVLVAKGEQVCETIQGLKEKFDSLDRLKIDEKRKHDIQMGQLYDKTSQEVSSLLKVPCELKEDGFQKDLEKIFRKIKENMGRKLCPESVILQKETDEKVSFLADSLEKEKGRRIRFCELLYRYDTINKVNFHIYIDNKPDILMIIKLLNGSVLGGYSQREVNSLNVPGKGFLYSVTNKFVLNLFHKNSKQAKVISPDDLNIIFGNSELRIKVGSDVVFSNLGLVNAYFNDKEMKVRVHDLLGGGDGIREVKVDTYEFYQINFV